MPMGIISNEYFNKLRKNKRRPKNKTFCQEQSDGKSFAIDPAMFDNFAGIFSEPLLDDSGRLSEELSAELRLFENNWSLQELERFSNQTIVGIAQKTLGRKKGCYILVANLLKTLADGALGLGFPGGRVQPGESPVSRLIKEYQEEAGLIVEAMNAGQVVAEHKVGEEGHRFSAIEVKITGGKAEPVFTKIEQIIAVIFVDEETLIRVCRNDGRINVRGLGSVGVLRSHREAFLQYLEWRNNKEVEADDNKKEEVANV